MLETRPGKASELISQKSGMRQPFVPPALKSVDDTGLSGLWLQDLVLKVLYFQGYLTGLPSWVAEELRPDGIILIEADPKRIVIRRLEDKTRDRDLEEIQSIQLHQDLSRSMAISCGLLIGSIVKIVNNLPGEPDEAAQIISKILVGEE